MSKAGSVRSYSSKEKGSWRGSVWREIAKRQRGDKNRGVYLYLAGPEDNDRRQATRCGIKEHNLIGVDISHKNVRSVRNGGGLAIHDNALDVLWSWPNSTPVIGVMLDFCSGIEKENINVHDALAIQPLRRSVLAVNLMRGRDPWSNSVRDVLQQAFPKEFSVDRSVQFLLYHAFESVNTVLYGPITARPSFRNKWGQRVAASCRWSDLPHIRTVALSLVSKWKPKHFSYKSGPLTFDSVVYEPFSFYADELDKYPDPELDSYRKANSNIKTIRRIAATLATRTRRLSNGWLVERAA